MKILHVEAGRHLYGGARQVLYIVQGLARLGVDNVLACPTGSELAQAADGLPGLVTLRMGGDADVGMLWRLRGLMRRHAPDLVHLHSRRGADIWGGMAARSLGLPVLLSRRVDNPESRRWMAIKYRMFDHVIAISAGIQQVLLDGGLSPERVSCIPSSVDTQEYQGGCRQQWFLQEFRLQPDDFVVGVVAQFIPRKGHLALIEVLPELCRSYPQFRLLLFGRGPLEREIRQLIERSGLDRQVIVAGFRRDLRFVLPCLDLLIHPALLEGLGVSLLQAAACEVPICAFETGGVPETLLHGESGYLAPLGDMDALIDHVGQLVAQPDLATQMGLAGRAYVQRQFSVQQMVDAHAALYRRLLDRRVESGKGRD